MCVYSRCTLFFFSFSLTMKKKTKEKIRIFPERKSRAKKSIDLERDFWEVVVGGSSSSVTTDDVARGFCGRGPTLSSNAS